MCDTRQDSLLVVSPDSGYVAALSDHLIGGTLPVSTLCDLAGVLERLHSGAVACIVYDDHDQQPLVVDAVTVLEIVRTMAADLPFVLLTDSETARTRATAAGVTAVLSRNRSEWPRLADLVERVVDADRARCGLLDAEAHAHARLDAAPDAIAVVRDGEYVFVNRAGTDLLAAVERAELLGVAVDTTLCLHDGRQLTRWLATVQAGDPAVDTGVVTLQHGPRGGRSIDVTAARVEWAGTPAVALVCPCGYGRRDQPWLLARTRYLLSDMERLTNAGGWLVDLERGVVWWSPSTRRLHGVSDDYTPTLEEALAFFHLDDAPVLQRLVERCRETGAPYDTELRLVTARGDERQVSIHGEAIEEDGHVVALRGVVQDITDRVERSRQLRRTQRAVEASNSAILITDVDGAIEYVNPAFERITGYTAAEAVGQTPRILKSGEMPTNYYEELWEMLLAGERRDDEFINRRKDGELYYAHQTIAPFYGIDGAIEGFVAIQTDISHHKDRLQQLRVLDRVLRHNLRNDMNIIMGNAQTLEPVVPASHADRLEQVLEHSDHLMQLAENERRITELLSADQQRRHLDVGSMIRALTEQLAEEYPHATIGTDVPETVMVWASTDLEAALTELVENAVVHSDRERPAVDVHVSVDGDTVELRVDDDGPGVPEMDRAVVAGTRSIEPLYHGSGLGLWLVRWVVRRSGGRVEFDDRTPRGSSVIITLDTVAPTANGDGHR